jgi:4,5-DOPA dioxygenase extradiol
MRGTLPVIFFGHGNPMHAISSNGYTQSWRKIGQAIPRPKAILAVSAHWYIPETSVTASKAPRTIHDFSGFPPELYQVQYPAPGDPELAHRVQELLMPLEVKPDSNWGLDHGTWSVLRHVYPDADIPIVQLSINRSMPAPFHYEIGRKIRPLRNEGVLIIGSGNLVHNLRTYAWGQHMPEPYGWAVQFEQAARQKMLAGEHDSLIHYEQLGKDAKLSVPTPDHYLPLLYVLGATQKHERVQFPVEGIDGGSISMLTVQVG